MMGDSLSRHLHQVLYSYKTYLPDQIKMILPQYIQQLDVLQEQVP